MAKLAELMGGDSEETIIRFGSSVKALGNGRVGGYGVLFGTVEEKDADGDFFTVGTDYDLARDTKCTPYYAHCQDPEIKSAKLGLQPFEMKADDVGVWMDGQLNLRNKYEKAMYKMAEEGKLGWSTGTAPHLVERKAIKDDGGTVVAHEITKWPLGLDISLTPIPCDKRTKAMALKSLNIPTLDSLIAAKSMGMSQTDKWIILQDTLRTMVGKGEDPWGYPRYAWLVDVFDTSLVYVLDDGDADTDYFEAPYKFSGNTATIGEPVQVIRSTAYAPMTDVNEDDQPSSTKAISGNTKDLNSLRFVDHSNSVRTAVKGYAPRVRDYIKTRSEHAKAISDERAEEFKSIKTELLDAIKAIDEALSLNPVPKGDPDAIKRLRIEALQLDPSNWDFAQKE